MKLEPRLSWIMDVSNRVQALNIEGSDHIGCQWPYKSGYTTTSCKKWTISSIITLSTTGSPHLFLLAKALSEPPCLLPFPLQDNSVLELLGGLCVVRVRGDGPVWRIKVQMRRRAAQGIETRVEGGGHPSRMSEPVAWSGPVHSTQGTCKGVMKWIQITTFLTVRKKESQI